MKVPFLRRRWALLTVLSLLSFTSALPLFIFRTAGSLRIDAAKIPWCSKAVNHPISQTTSASSSSVVFTIPRNTTSLIFYRNMPTHIGVCYSSVEKTIFRDTLGGSNVSAVTYSDTPACLLSISSEDGFPEKLEIYNACNYRPHTYKDGTPVCLTPKTFYPRFQIGNISQCMDLAYESYSQPPKDSILSRRDDDDKPQNSFGNKMDLVIGLVSTLIVLVIGISVIAACYHMRLRRKEKNYLSGRPPGNGDKAQLKSSDAELTFSVPLPSKKDKASDLPKYGYTSQDKVVSKFSGTTSSGTRNSKTYDLGTSQEHVVPSSASLLTMTSTVVAPSAPPSSPIPQVPKIPDNALIHNRRSKALPAMPLLPQPQASQELGPSRQEQRGNSALLIHHQASSSESSTNSTTGQRSITPRGVMVRNKPPHPPPNQPLPNPNPMVNNPNTRTSSMQNGSVSRARKNYGQKPTPPGTPGELTPSKASNLQEAPRAAGPSVTSPGPNYRDRYGSLSIIQTESPQDYSFTPPENGHRHSRRNRRSGRDMRKPHISLRIPVEPIDWLSTGNLSLISEITESDRSYNEKVPVVAPLKPRKRPSSKSGGAPLAQHTMASTTGNLPSTIGDSQKVKNVMQSSPVPKSNPPEYSVTSGRRPLPRVPMTNMS